LGVLGGVEISLVRLYLPSISSSVSALRLVFSR